MSDLANLINQVGKLDADEAAVFAKGAEIMLDATKRYPRDSAKAFEHFFMRMNDCNMRLSKRG